MNGNKKSGKKSSTETPREMAGKKTFGREKQAGAESLAKGGMTGKKKFPFAWLLPLAGLSVFFGHFWSYVPVVRGIVSLFVISKFCGTHFLL